MTSAILEIERTRMVLFDAGAYTMDYVWYSDDNGKTWTMSKTSFPKMDEAQLVETAEGFVIANMRNDHLNATCDCRATATSQDGGVTFSAISYDPVLISPVCQASVVSYEGGSIAFANPASRTDRVNGTVRISHDGAKTWTGELLIAESDYAYSCLVSLGGSTLGLLWETSTSDCVGPSCQLAFSVFPAP